MSTCSAGIDAERPGAVNKKIVTEGRKEPEVAVRNDDGTAVDHEYHEWRESDEPPTAVGILKKSIYVSGEESETEEVGHATEDSKQEGGKGREGRRKLVPVWRLVSCFTF